MVFKLVMSAAKTWRRLKGENQLPKVIAGVTFQNGAGIINTPEQSDARSRHHPNSGIARGAADQGATGCAVSRSERQAQSASCQWLLAPS